MTAQHPAEAIAELYAALVATEIVEDPETVRQPSGVMLQAGVAMLAMAYYEPEYLANLAQRVVSAAYTDQDQLRKRLRLIVQMFPIMAEER